MDYTKKYMLMCKNAHFVQENVQELLPNAYGALYINEHKKVNLHKKVSPEFLNDTGLTWLPRFDELLTISGWSTENVAFHLQKTVDDIVNFPFINTMETLEKIMLCVVMFNRCNNEWSDEELDWVPIKMYGIGTKRNDGEGWGCIAGPTRKLDELINHPLHPDALKDTKDWYIINLYVDKPVYKWDTLTDNWVSVI
jgi:hypothetical protein